MANSVGFVETLENQVARRGWRASIVKRKGLYCLPRNSRLLTNVSSPMSVGQQKPREGENISVMNTDWYVESPAPISTDLLKSSPAGKKRGLASDKYNSGVGEVVAREKPSDAAKIWQ
jgi:hypothetical protein